MSASHQNIDTYRGWAMENIIGFRQYLKSGQSYADLLKIIRERDTHFPGAEGFVTIVAVCGDNPRAFLEQEGLLGSVTFYNYAPWEANAAKVAEVFSKSYYRPERVQIVYYSDRPMGLTYPLEFLIAAGNRLGTENVAVSDSDFQMPYTEIRRAYDFHLSISDPREAVITYPRRGRRSLDAEDYPINRWAMEDLENMYIYMLSDLRALNKKADFQSGLSITSRAANLQLNFDNVGSWIGNLHMAIQVMRNNGRLENEFIVQTNVQNESTINFDVQCAKIEQLHRYYMIPLSNIVHLALNHPDEYLMQDWTKNLSKEKLEADIHAIEAMYRRYIENKDRR